MIIIDLSIVGCLTIYGRMQDYFTICSKMVVYNKCMRVVGVKIFKMAPGALMIDISLLK